MQTSVAWLVVALICECRVQASHIPWWNIRLAQEQGPNVCVVEEVVGTKHHVWTECKYWNTRDVCGAKPLLRYECCEGFKRIPDTKGCMGVTPLENVLNTAKQLGAGIFVQYLKNSALSQELQNEGPYTLFAPSDEAFAVLPRDRSARFNSNDTDYIKSVLAYHVAEGRITSSHFKANVLVPTKHNGHKLRINKYSSRVETVNCALLQRKDQEASNGVVHIISDILDPSASVQRDLAELLVQDGRFQQLSLALDKTGLMSKLGSQEQSFTILAPSDEAFTKILPSRLSKILNDKIALQELLDNHILPHLICTPAIIGEHKVGSLGANKVTFDCDRNGVKMENNQLHGDFVLGSNGVIHVINDVLVPDRAKSIIQILEEEKEQTFLQILRFAGLEDAFENFGEYTVFVPSEAAMNSLPEATLNSLKTKQEKARAFILFHVTQGRLTTEKLKNHQELPSLNEGIPLRILLYRSGVTSRAGPHITTAVEGAIVQKPDRECMNGVVHVIANALFPVDYTLEELLERKGNFKIFLKVLANLTSESVLREKTRTYFVPTDAAFQNIDGNLFERMMSNSTFISKVLRNHQSETMTVSQGLQPDLHYIVPSNLGTLMVTLQEGKMKVNNADVLESDILTANGTVHIISQVLLPYN